MDEPHCSMDAPFPHCDSRVLHAPGECRACDKYPMRQRARITGNIAFTGQEFSSQLPDPATEARPLETINRWPGNRPVSHENPPAGYGPCTREEGHEGPCALPRHAVHTFDFTGLHRVAGGGSDVFLCSICFEVRQTYTIGKNLRVFEVLNEGLGGCAADGAVYIKEGRPL